MTQDDLNETARQAALDRLSIDQFADTALDDIARTAADMFQAPIAFVSLVDGDRQRFKSAVGSDLSQTPRGWAFCDHAIRRAGEVMVVEDATLDPRFVDNPLVTGDPHVRFYAGAPLVTSSGHAIGTVCVLDVRPRQAPTEQLETLRFLAQQVVSTLEKRGG